MLVARDYVCWVTILEILSAATELQREITELPDGAPELDGVIDRIRSLQRELEILRGSLGALVPDAASPPSPDEVSAEKLDDMLGALMSAARSKTVEATVGAGVHE
jgi:hypothetical protein